MFMELHREEKREEGEREVARMIKGGIKRKEADPASNKCSPQPGTHKEIHRVG